LIIMGLWYTTSTMVNLKVYEMFGYLFEKNLFEKIFFLSFKH
jgi:hypothetical protein